MIREIACADPQSLARHLADEVCAALAQAIATRGEASLAVSGGRTPKRLFEILATRELDWGKVRVTLADERLVAHDSADLNANLVRGSLLQGRAAAARFHPLWEGEGEPRAVAEAALKHFPGAFDLLLLGMGDDGHTASLFPQAPGLEAALDIANPAPLLFLPATPARQPRVSLTLSRLAQSRRILIAFEGQAKRAVYDRARQTGPEAELPIRAILRLQGVPVELHWSET